jgi:uncharacterized integral membrane protein
MWIVRWILGAIFIALIIGFAMQNTEQKVNVIFLKWQSIDMPLWVIMYVAFISGMLFWLVVSILRVVTLKVENRKGKKEIQKLKDELNRLRNVSVEESDLPVDTGDELSVQSSEE